ncbi:MAG: hypothetical protein Q9226_002405 [Calogaya cf. arnoldii]
MWSSGRRSRQLEASTSRIKYCTKPLKSQTRSSSCHASHGQGQLGKNTAPPATENNPDSERLSYSATLPRSSATPLALRCVVIACHLLYGSSFAEIERKIGVPEENARDIYHRALQRAGCEDLHQLLVCVGDAELSDEFAPAESKSLPIESSVSEQAEEFLAEFDDKASSAPRPKRVSHGKETSKEDTAMAGRNTASAEENTALTEEITAPAGLLQVQKFRAYPRPRRKLAELDDDASSAPRPKRVSCGKETSKEDTALAGSNIASAEENTASVEERSASAGQNTSAAEKPTSPTEAKYISAEGSTSNMWAGRRVTGGRLVSIVDNGEGELPSLVEDAARNNPDTPQSAEAVAASNRIEEAKIERAYNVDDNTWIYNYREANAKRLMLIGTALLSSIDVLKSHKLFHSDSNTEVRNIGLILCHYLQFAYDQREIPRLNEAGWTKLVIQRAEEHGIAIEGFYGIGKIISALSLLAVEMVKAHEKGGTRRDWGKYDLKREVTAYRRYQMVKVGPEGPVENYGGSKIGFKFYDLTGSYGRMLVREQERQERGKEREVERIEKEKRRVEREAGWAASRARKREELEKKRREKEQNEQGLECDCLRIWLRVQGSGFQV